MSIVEATGTTFIGGSDGDRALVMPSNDCWTVRQRGAYSAAESSPTVSGGRLRRTGGAGL